jgi:hypothetical protein
MESEVDRSETCRVLVFDSSIALSHEFLEECKPLGGRIHRHFRGRDTFQGDTHAEDLLHLVDTRLSDATAGTWDDLEKPFLFEPFDRLHHWCPGNA